MLSIFLLILYGTLILIYLVSVFFIVYHLFKYSSRPETGLGMAAFFLSVSAVLLLANAMLFFSINWETLLKNILF